MSASDAQHARCFTILGVENPNVVAILDGTNLSRGQKMNVREVLPGEITITREEFKAAYRKACGRITMNKSFETILEAELWPEGTQVPE